MADVGVIYNVPKDTNEFIILIVPPIYDLRIESIIRNEMKM